MTFVVLAASSVAILTLVVLFLREHRLRRALERLLASLINVWRTRDEQNAVKNNNRSAATDTANDSDRLPQ
jgi:hypothetical protein